MSASLVVTAAHCTERFEEYESLKSYKGDILMNFKLRFEYEIRAGEFNPRLKRTRERRIESYEIHPNYDNRSFYYDVAILFLDEPLTLSKKIYPICLPTKGTEASEITNWGLTVQGWSPSSVTNQDKLVLTEINVKVRPSDQCSTEFESLASSKPPLIPRTILYRYLPELLKKSQFCAKSLSGGRIYFGDSGGPAFHEYLEFFKVF